MSTVLQALTASLLRSLYHSTKSLTEFQVALTQFYDSSDRRSCVNRLRGSELKECVDFLEDVRHPFKLFTL
jgi:hypothetical protein